MENFRRLVRPLKNKIFLLFGRALLYAVNNSEMTQKIQVVALDGEVITDMERFQEYGFETYPFTESEVAIVFLNGNRDHGIALCVHDRRYRPDNLSEGEITLYTDEDLTNDFRVWLKRNRILVITNDKLQITSDTLGYWNCQEITLGSDTRAAVRRLIDERFKTLFNDHVHSGVDPGGGNSGPPTTTVAEADHMTDYVRGL